MVVKILTEGIRQYMENNAIILDFGTIKYKQNAELDLSVSGDFKKLGVNSTCGCTVGTPEQQPDGTYNVHIKYKSTHVKSAFVKTLLFKYDNKTQQVKIKGEVI